MLLFEGFVLLGWQGSTSTLRSPTGFPGLYWIVDCMLANVGNAVVRQSMVFRSSKRLKSYSLNGYYVCQSYTLLITEIVQILPNNLIKILICKHWTITCYGMYVSPNMIQCSDLSLRIGIHPVVYRRSF